MCELEEADPTVVVFLEYTGVDVLPVLVLLCVAMRGCAVWDDTVLLW